jgi:glycosyltransferase involved in cell wall biosynthesis
MTLVSVLIPTYNQARYIRQAVESALQQDWAEIEVVVVDDASTDNTQYVLDAYRDDERVRIYLNETNLGRVGNYRRALHELARGIWALVLDGDDYLIDSSYISRAMRRVQMDPRIDLVFANAYKRRDDLDGRLSRPRKNKRLPEVIEGAELFLRLASEKISLYHLTCLYNVEKARNLDFYRADIVSSDWESLFRYILTGRVAFVSDIVAVWRIHGDNATRTLSAKDRIDNLQQVFGPYEEAKARGVFPDKVIDAWCTARLEAEARKHVLDLVRSDDVGGLQQFMAALLGMSPRAHARINSSPSLRWARTKRAIFGSSS